MENVPIKMHTAGIDIDNASKKLDLKDLTLSHIPSEVHIKSV